MPIYERALSPQRQVEGLATGMLGLVTPPQLPGRPPLPSTDVGNVDFEGAIQAQNQIQAQQSAQATQELVGALSGLASTGILGASGFYGRGNQDRAPGGAPGGGGGGILQGTPYQGDLYGVQGGIPLGPGPLGDVIPLAPGPLTRFG